MCASAAEHALAKQAHMSRLQKALHDAMPCGVCMSTAVLQTVIAQAEAVAPPGSTLLEAVRVAKEAQDRGSPWSRAELSILRGGH